MDLYLFFSVLLLLPYVIDFCSHTNNLPQEKQKA